MFFVDEFIEPNREGQCPAFTGEVDEPGLIVHDNGERFHAHAPEDTLGDFLGLFVDDFDVEAREIGLGLQVGLHDVEEIAVDKARAWRHDGAYGACECVDAVVGQFQIEGKVGVVECTGLTVSQVGKFGIIDDV